jgi:hypothetical protein
MKMDDPTGKDSGESRAEGTGPEESEADESIASAAGAAKTADRAMKDTAQKYLGAAGIKVDLEDIESKIRDRPLFSLAIAAGAGFAIGGGWQQKWAWRFSACLGARRPLKPLQTSAARYCARLPEATNPPHRQDIDRMRAPSRKTMVVVIAAGAVVVARAGLPALLTWLANMAVRKIPGIRGKVRRVQIDFMTPGLTAKDVSVATLNGGAPGHRIEVGAIAVNSQWKSLLTGALVASLRVDAPRLWFNADAIRSAHDGNGKREAQREKSGPPWQEKLTQLPRFKVASAILTDGEVRVVGAPGERDAEVSVDRLNLCAENITNSTELAPTLMAKLSADACLLSSGTFQLQAQGYPLAKVPTFNADLSSSDIDLSVLRDIIQKAVDIDVRHGIAGLYVEAAAADGYVSGYAKPVFDHLELEPPVHSGFFARLKA